MNPEDAKKHLQMKLRARKTSEWKGMQSFEAQALNSTGKLAWTDLKERVMLLAKLYLRGVYNICSFWFFILVFFRDEVSENHHISVLFGCTAPGMDAGKIVNVRIWSPAWWRWGEIQVGWSWVISTDHRNTPSTSSLRRKSTCNRSGGQVGWVWSWGWEETCSETVQTSDAHIICTSYIYIYTLHFIFLALVVDILTPLYLCDFGLNENSMQRHFFRLPNDLTAT